MELDDAMALLRDDDARQELREAVCDAVLERVRREVSGEGESGASILGERPSRVLASGFILPKLNADGDDESSDIRIPSHGMDVALIGNITGTVSVRLRVSVYLRALPSSAQLFARGGHFLPSARFNAAANRLIKAQRDAARATRITAEMSRSQRIAENRKILEDIYRGLGVVVPAGAMLVDAAPQESQGEEQESGATPVMPTSLKNEIDRRLCIPSAYAVEMQIPQRWVRVDVPVVDMALPLPGEPAAWEMAAQATAVQLRDAIRDACAAWIASPDGQAWAWRAIPSPSEAYFSPAAWERFLGIARASQPNPGALIPNFEIAIVAQLLRDNRHADRFSARIAIENLRECDGDHEFGLFGLCITVEAPEAAIAPLSLERVKRSYHLEGFLSMPAIGVNCGIADCGTTEGRIKLQTTWMPRYVLPRMTTRTMSDSGVESSFCGLASDSLDVGSLKGLPDALESWVDSLVPPESRGDADTVTQQVVFATDQDAWRAEAARITLGISVLQRSQTAYRSNGSCLEAIPYRAWLLMNRTFDVRNPATSQRSKPGWRLFQLAFVLAHVPTFASRVRGYQDTFRPEFDEQAITLLYLATGGGKTEAFFGAILYALFLDRLRGKSRGVTAMMHYPLRLLTVQQAQRLARLLAKAEIIRRDEGLVGQPFEIGFFVGGNNTPNSTASANGRINDELRCIPVVGTGRAIDESARMAEDAADPLDREYQRAQENWNKLPVCPFCDSGGTALRIFPTRRQRLGIVCRYPGCDWNRMQAESAGCEPLPFLLADSDIFRRAPAILLGTIDKLALLGHSMVTISKMAGMFGLGRFLLGGIDGLIEMEVPEGTLDVQMIAPAFANGQDVFYDPFPSIIVQDEMHLLEESLGTFGGLFESGLFEWFSEMAKILGPRVVRTPGAPGVARMPHIIGATATASDVTRQARSLYLRRAIQFPHPGPALNGGFYVCLAEYAPGGAAALARGTPLTPRERELAAPWARVYASLMTNGRKHTVTTMAVLAHHAATITRWMRDIRDPEMRDGAAVEMMACVSAAPWPHRRRLAIGQAVQSGHWHTLLALLDLHRIMLTYVTNKKGGDQILSALPDEIARAHAAMGERYDLEGDYETSLISGGVDIGTIQSVIEKAERLVMNPPEGRAFSPRGDDVRRGLRQIVATSAVSHGVDVENFNAMAFAGLPSDVAEYIQASSRVGRKHVGFSILVPTPQTRRDRYVVEVHESFHRLLERMIPAPASERWAERAIQRSVASFMQTWVAGVYHQRVFAMARDDEKPRIVLPTNTSSVESILRDPGRMQECVKFVCRAFGIWAETGGASNPQYYSEVVRQQIDRIRRGVAEAACSMQDFWKVEMANIPAPMTSLRDVESQALVHPTAWLTGKRKVDPALIIKAMRAVRVGSSKRRGGGSELEADEVISTRGASTPRRKP